MISIVPPERNDNQGLGHFGAPRGARKHNGVDLAAYPSSVILSPVAGKVTKLGYPYSDDLSWRYVQVTVEKGWRDPSTTIAKDLHYRFFYVQPVVSIGEFVTIGQKLGHLQDLTIRYPGITTHLHFEVKCENEYIDPSRVTNFEI